MKNKVILQNRKIDKFGNVIYFPDDIIEKIYSDKNFLNYIYEESEDIISFNKIMNDVGIDMVIKTENVCDLINEDEIKNMIDDWFMPEEYKNIDVESWFLGKNLSEIEKKRVEYELKIFKKNNGYDFLRFLIYLVDFMKENNIIWGAGRGSSVSSYCLYLIGIHRINSIEYGLDFEEFIS